MNKQSIIIYDFEILFIILKEIKENLRFEIFNFKKNDEISKLDNSTYGNYLIVVKSLSNFINKDIEKKKLYLIENLPIKIDQFIEKINIQLLKQKYNYQLEIRINKYKLNLNSREISLNKKLIKLTEREIDIILFLNENKKPINIDILQKEVWGYSSELETHTVETHIYRLRKKLKDKFNDEEFILSLKKGYQIK
ncbi:MAG TPA: winged helix family transcriptional regulator [Candidatus Pelagibacter sp.]|nr:winged helix family transcriptional regulator [Candidatus Pelagibacter sp.]|tara:strand:- start:188 stop:772 length:585 start_codon:yes stop_codon:yes gene_type:complete